MKRMLSKTNLLLIIMLCLLAACSSTTSSSYGPIKDDNFQEVIAENVIGSTEQIVFYSRAIWFANKNGFKFLPAGKKSRKGVIVCTDQALYFAEWKANKFSPVFTAKYSEISAQRLAANELFGRLVIKADSYNSFEILGVGGPDLPNKEETEVAFEIIKNQKQ